MPWEIDYALLLFSRLKQSSYFLPSDVNVEFNSCLNLSSYIIDWEKSLFPKQYFIDKYNEISNNFTTIKHTPKIIESNTLYGHLDFQKEAISEHVDFYITMCPDMHFSEMLIPYIIESIKVIPNKNFIITPQITKRWDSSWDVLVNENFTPLPYTHCFDLSCYDIDPIHSNSLPEIQPLQSFKYAGWFDCFSKEIYETLTPIWEEWSGYGSWDTYSMMTLSLLKNQGYDIQQYVIKNQIISEYWNGNVFQQNWDIDTYKDKNSEGLCGYYKKHLHINKNKDGKLDYNKLQEYAITQFNKIINNG
jgi:hypothetical protein